MEVGWRWWAGRRARSRWAFGTSGSVGRLQRQYRRLKLIANNSRFAVLVGKGEVRNLASRVLGLSLRRLSGDMRAAHGFPVLLAETFVDPSRFSGVCYRALGLAGSRLGRATPSLPRASNWRMLGLTRGYSRVYGSPARWREHGQPKEVYVYELEAGAREALRDGHAPVEAREPPMPAGQLRRLHDCLGEMDDFRKRRGQRYGLGCYLTIMIAARLAGYRGVSAFGEFAARLNDAQRRAVGGFFSPTRRRYTVPAASTFHYILSKLPPDTVDRALRAWSAQHAGLSPVAMDGKDVRGASKRTEGERQMMVAAVEHGSGLVLGQVRIGAKSNEIPAVRELARQLDLAGRVVTLDALHAQHDTARCLVEDCKAHYAITAVKGNQPSLHEDLADIDWSQARWSADALDKAHGRLETRRCAAVDLTLAKWDGRCDLHRTRAGRARGARARRAQDRRSHPRDRLRPHLARRRRGRTRRTAEHRAPPLGSGEPGPLRARLQLRRGPLPRRGGASAAKPGGAQQRRDLHRARDRPLRLHSPGKPPLRRAPAGRARRHPDPPAALTGGIPEGPAEHRQVAPRPPVPAAPHPMGLRRTARPGNAREMPRPRPGPAVHTPTPAKRPGQPHRSLSPCHPRTNLRVTFG